MADLSALFNYAPTTAGALVGQQQAMDTQSQGLEQQKLQQLIEGMKQDQAQSAAMNPLRVQELQQKNRGTGLANDLTQATQDSTIGATNAGNSLKISSDNVKQAQQAASMFSSWAGILDATPDEPGARPAKMMELLKSANMDPNSPQVAPLLKVFSQTPSAKLPQTLRTIGDDLVHHSAAYMQANDVENTRAAAVTQSATTHANATVQAATISADAKRDVQGLKNSQKDGLNQLVAAKNFQGAATMAEAFALSETDPDRKQALHAFAARMAAADQAARAAGATANKPDINSLGIQTVPPNNPLATPPASPLGNAGTGGVPEQAKTAWGAYEPAKYDYRVGPNGTLQRKPKG